MIYLRSSMTGRRWRMLVATTAPSVVGGAIGAYLVPWPSELDGAAPPGQRHPGVLHSGTGGWNPVLLGRTAAFVPLDGAAGRDLDASAST